MKRRRRTRRNPDAGALVLGGAAALTAYAAFRIISQQSQGGESVNYPSGQVPAVSTSAASGLTAGTSHPSGKGQPYV